MSKKYVDEDGSYLCVYEVREGIVLTWFCDDDFGAVVGENADDTNEETRVLNEAVRGFCNGHKETAFDNGPGQPFTFETRRVAHMALAVANAALIAWRDNIPFPAWAKTALAEGWKPPKGWKPPMPEHKRNDGDGDEDEEV